jgi:hypothetical protein
MPQSAQLPDGSPEQFCARRAFFSKIYAVFCNIGAVCPDKVLDDEDEIQRADCDPTDVRVMLKQVILIEPVLHLQGILLPNWRQRA